jgi:CheY-like chemotaxis protein
LIEVTVERVTAELVPDFRRRQRGAYALVRVRDNGVGIDEKIRTRLFEPFFTTKGPNRGTGLGLATSHAVISEHGGIISCQSTPNHGATFAVYLPLEEEHESTRMPILNLADTKRKLRVLVVEDDAMVRKITLAIVQSGEHETREAGSAEEALTRLRTEPGVDVVLLDRSMPNASGATILSEIRELAPKAKIIYFTGGDVPEDEQGRVDGVLYKPVGRNELLAGLQRIIHPA